MRAAIELAAVPDHSTLQKAPDRLLPALSAGRLLDMTIRLAQLLGKLDTRLPMAAMDGTGLESHHASAYYVRRKAKGGEIRAEADLAAVP